MRRTAHAVVAVVVGGVLLLLGCGSDGDAATPVVDDKPAASSIGIGADELVDGLDVFVEYPRYLQADGREIEVAVRNGSEHEIEVRSVALRSAMFEELATEPRQARLRVDQRTDYRVGFGAARCDGDRTAHAVALVIAVDGSEREGLVAVDPEPLLAISDAECGALAVRRVADIGFGAEFSVVEDVVEATLDVALRDGDGPVRVASMRGSVILAAEPVAAEGSPLVEVDGDRPEASAPVRLWAARCDPHGVAESKRTFDIPIWVSSGSYVEQFIVVRPEGELRDVLQSLINDCLAGG